MPASTPDRYHHGDLRNEVKRAALRMLADEGPAALSLRRVAAAAGVSHTAPRHHFADKRALLTDLAVDGFERLDAAIRAVTATTGDPAERLAAMLAAYAGFHRVEPGYASIMWRNDLLDRDDPRLREGSLGTFRLLYDAVCAAGGPAVEALGAYRASLLYWALAHGSSTLAERFTPGLAAAIGEDDPDLPSADELLAQFVGVIS
jgi:AcrR family transcriptional regulator